RIDVAEDEHLHVSIKTPERPHIDLDIHNGHGRRTLSVRANGMCIASLLLDVEELPPQGNRVARYCPYCGEQRDLLSSVDRHEC
ncbi:MAG TPA: hypothetical protein VKE92_08625, partial [Anaerolineales bacterium]|nr:hypothetical protein [Anaerolineales bacterium]